MKDDSGPESVALRDWISECHAALASADALAARLARQPGWSSSDVAELRAGILLLRAALERRENGDTAGGRRQQHPKWSKPASAANPWCPPDNSR